MYGMSDEIIGMADINAALKALITELEAERDALAARIAGGVRVSVWIDDGIWALTADEMDAILPLDGQTVTVIGDKP